MLNLNLDLGDLAFICNALNLASDEYVNIAKRVEIDDPSLADTFRHQAQKAASLAARLQEEEGV